MKVSVGPVLYHWNRGQLLDFYARVAESDVDIVYLGEAVCAKRRALGTDDWIALARDLVRGSGKEVVLSTLALIEAESELGVVRRLARDGGLAIEANDFGAVQAARDAGIPFVAGHTLNIYNADTLAVLATAGAKRWVAPVELSRESIGALVSAARARGIAVEAELFAHGHLPLAHSARCFSARARDLPKDQCGFVCGDRTDGTALYTREDAALFRLNGIQTQSYARCDLFGERDDAARRGIDVLRFSPSTPADADLLPRLVAQARGQHALAMADADACNGYWFGTAGMRHAPA